MSRTKRGVNRFAAYQDEKVRRREGFIKDYLDTLRKSRVSVKYVTDLANMVAVHIAQVEDGKCSASTLLRNDKYKALLMSYLAERAGKDKLPFNGVSAGQSTVETALLGARIEISNLKSEGDRLRGYIAELERKLENPTQEKPALSQTSSATCNRDEEISELKYKYIQTCQVVHFLLEYWKDYLGVDMEQGKIIDLSYRRGDHRQVIVEPKIAMPFFEWLRLR